MPAFDLLVVGAGGGPSEANLSGYLLKSHDTDWSDGLVGIEAGSGLGALERILREKPDLLSDGHGSRPSAAGIYSRLRTYLVTHAHLDHVLSLVLLAGSTDGPRKTIRGSRQCLEDLRSIFQPNRIWPTLADKYDYEPLPVEPGVYVPVHGGISTSMFPLSHGVDYTSAAFFLRHEASGREFLFFGDVEPDKFSVSPRTVDIWRAAAPKIVQGSVDTILIECSYPSGRPDDMLFGHLSPPHLVSELETLADIVAAYRNKASSSSSEQISTTRKRALSTSSPESKGLKHSEEIAHVEESHDALSGLRVYIIHCKDDMEGKYTGRPMNLVISEQVRDLVERKRLGATVLAAEQGTVIHI